jgi:hypothetical protein
LDNNLHACGSRRRGYPCHGTLQPVGPEATGSLGDLEHEHHRGPGLRGQAAQHLAWRRPSRTVLPVREHLTRSSRTRRLWPSRSQAVDADGSLSPELPPHRHPRRPNLVLKPSVVHVEGNRLENEPPERGRGCLMRPANLPFCPALHLADQDTGNQQWSTTAAAHWPMGWCMQSVWNTHTDHL